MGGNMDQRDIDAYLAAKRQLRVGRWVLYLCGVLMVVAGALCILGIALPFSKGILWGAVVALLLNGSDFILGSTAVSRQRLLDIIQRQISRDPDAVMYVARRAQQSRSSDPLASA
jgi:hypothetical protein